MWLPVCSAHTICTLVPFSGQGFLAAAHVPWPWQPKRLQSWAFPFLLLPLLSLHTPQLFSCLPFSLSAPQQIISKPNNSWTIPHCSTCLGMQGTSTPAQNWRKISSLVVYFFASKANKSVHELCSYVKVYLIGWAKLYLPPRIFTAPGCEKCGQAWCVGRWRLASYSCPIV